MRLGLVSDVHGNRVALEAVVADGRAQGVAAWWGLGDPAALGPGPGGTLGVLGTPPPPAWAPPGRTPGPAAPPAPRPPPTRAEAAADPVLMDRLVEVESSFSWTRGALAAGGWLDWLGGLAPGGPCPLPPGPPPRG